MKTCASPALAGCPAPPEPTPADSGTDADAGGDAGLADAGADAGSKAAACASTFGSALTASFGRLDGTVVAVVTPADQQCAMPNGDHVIVQVRAQGAVYRMVVNVQSNFGDPNVRFGETRAPLTAPAWSEGWHPGASIDYPTTLSLHTDAGFTPLPMAQLVARVADAIPLGARVSTYATSTGGSYSHSAHKVHRQRRPPGRRAGAGAGLRLSALAGVSLRQPGVLTLQLWWTLVPRPGMADVGRSMTLTERRGRPGDNPSMDAAITRFLAREIIKGRLPNRAALDELLSRVERGMDQYPNLLARPSPWRTRVPDEWLEDPSSRASRKLAKHFAKATDAFIPDGYAEQLKRLREALGQVTA